MSKKTALGSNEDLAVNAQLKEIEIEQNLPLSVRENSALQINKIKLPLWRRVFNKVRYLPLVMLFGATIGVIALYFQPPGLQVIMGVLGLEPGGGTSSPIAIPANPKSSQSGEIQIAKTDESKIFGLGKLLPEGDVTTIAPPFGAGDARIAQLLVKEGDTVTTGEILAKLDNEANILAAIENAKSTISVRQATLDQIKNSVRISGEEAQASLQRAHSAHDNALADFKRTEALFKRGFTTNAVLDQKKSTRDQANRDIQRLSATLKRYQATNLDEQPDVVVAARNVDAAISELKRAKSDLSKSQVKAPRSGTILNIYLRAGERPASKGIMDIGNIAKMTAEVEVYQTAIAGVRLGAKVALNAEALAQTLNGTVSKIGLEVESQKLVDADPAANTDARVITVTVALDEASSKTAKNFTNLQVLANIEAITQ